MPILSVPVATVSIPPRDPSRNPLVQVNLRVEAREPEVRLRGVSSEPILLDPGIARFDIAIELGITDEGLDGLQLHVINETAQALTAALEVVLLRDGHVVTARARTSGAMKTRRGSSH